MSLKADPEIHTPPAESLEELRRTDHEAFTAEVKALVKEAEATRLRYMLSRQRRGFFTMIVSFISLLAGACAFGWYFLVVGDLVKAVGYVALSTVPYILFSFWVNGPIKAYIRGHKNNFMPKLAKTLGGFRYTSDGGISAKVLSHTGIVPEHTTYRSEDCFTGIYKGIKVIFAEARLFKGGSKVFQGLFVLLELAKPTFEGHLILTADKKMAQDWASTRWQKLTAVPVTASNPNWNRFLAFSDKPEQVPQLVTEKLMKELSEAADIFNRAPLTAAFMKGKYIFIMIPNSEDMFEASKIDVPVPTSAHVEVRRKEIEKILEVLDVFAVAGR